MTIYLLNLLLFQWFFTRIGFYGITYEEDEIYEHHLAILYFVYPLTGFASTPPKFVSSKLNCKPIRLMYSGPLITPDDFR